MNSKQNKIGIHELYAQDAQKAEKLLWGSTSNRRGFLKRSAITAISAALGTNIVFANQFPSGLIPAALATAELPFELPGKHPELVVLNDRPINAETPPHLLDEIVTSADRLFVRNNGIPPEKQTIDSNNWVLKIEGESAVQTKSYTLAQLKAKFKQYTYQLTLECGGNGRKEFNPPAKGNQWSTGAVGCPNWTGVRLKDVLQDVGIKKDAVYIGYYGKDTHISCLLYTSPSPRDRG